MFKDETKLRCLTKTLEFPPFSTIKLRNISLDVVVFIIALADTEYIVGDIGVLI